MMDVIRGRVWKFGDNISTDLMLPGYATGSSPEEVAGFCMRSNRPDWAAQVKPGDIIVAGRNCGCGSSRPAARYLMTLGIQAVLAESISRLFLRNSINSGLVALPCRGVYQIFNEGDIAEVNIATGEVNNVITGASAKGEPLPDGSPPMEILRAGGIIPLLEKEYLGR
jgi:3-isopropylmalate/(R)-2-methylmalate dehydratase small subunit